MKDELVNNLIGLVNRRVVYCRMPMMFPLMVQFEGKDHLMCSRYWELSQYNRLLATQDDEDDDIINATLCLLFGKKLIGFSIYSDFSLLLYFEDNLDLIFFTEKEHDIKLKSLPNWELTVYETNIKSYVVDSQIKLKFEEEPMCQSIEKGNSGE